MNLIGSNTLFKDREEIQEINPSLEIKALPLEIFHRIFSFIPLKEVSSIRIVNKFWSKFLKDLQEKITKFSFKERELKAFAVFLKQDSQLKLNAIQEESLSLIIEDKTIAECINLTQFLFAYLELRRRSLIVLKDLTIDELLHLGKLVKKQSPLFQELIGLLKIYNVVTQAKIIDPLEKTNILNEILEALVDFEHLEYVVNLINKIIDIWAKNHAFQYLTKILIEQKEFSKFLRMINMISVIWIKENVLQSAFEFAIKKKQEH